MRETKFIILKSIHAYHLVVYCITGLECFCDIDCPLTGDYICGADQKTYPNQCQLQKASCKEQRSIAVAYKGRCTSDQMSGSGDGDGESFQELSPT